LSNDLTWGINDSCIESSKVSIKNCGGSDTGGLGVAQEQAGGLHVDGHEYPENGELEGAEIPAPAWARA
jgi:hypothetical protein